MPHLLPLLLSVSAPAMASGPASATQISGQVVAVGAQGRLSLNLTADHVRGGERAQIVRKTTTGTWVRAAVGDIAEVTPAGSVLVVTRYEPNMAGAVVGDYVVVTPMEVAPAAAGYPGYAGGAGQVPPAPAERPYAGEVGALATLPPKKIGDELAIAFGLKYMGAGIGKSKPEDAAAEESGKFGFGWSVGPAIEFRAFKYLGLETGLVYYQDSVGKKTTMFSPDGQSCQLQQDVKDTALKLPLIVKGVLPIEFDSETGMRLHVGLGVEWFFGRESKLSINEEQCSFGIKDLAADPVKPVDQTFFVLSLGVAATVEDVIISLDVRGMYRDISPEFHDYLKGDTEPMELTGGGGVLLGVSYEYDAL